MLSTDVSSELLVAEGLERLVEDVLTGARDAAALAPLVRAPVTAPLLLALAGPLRRRARTLDPPGNRLVLDVHDTVVADAGRARLAVGAALLAAAADATVAHQHPLHLHVALPRALRLRLDATPAEARAALDWTGFASLGPAWHPSVTRLAPLFSAVPRLAALVGPLVHPAPARAALVVVGEPGDAPVLLDALEAIGVEAAVVAHSGGAPFLDPHADTFAHVLQDRVRGMMALPGSGGGEDSAPVATSPARDAARLAALFAGAPDPMRDPLVLTTGAALWIAGLLPSLGEARAWASERLAQGVDLRELVDGERSATRPAAAAPRAAPTPPRPPRPPRAAARPARGRRG